MENVKSENRIFEGFKPRIPIVLIFALGVLLGSLTLLFGEVPVFSGAALFVLASLVFLTVREILPIVGILCPALFFSIASSSFSVALRTPKQNPASLAISTLIYSSFYS